MYLSIVENRGWLILACTWAAYTVFGLMFIPMTLVLVLTRLLAFEVAIMPFVMTGIGRLLTVASALSTPLRRLRVALMMTTLILVVIRDPVCRVMLLPTLMVVVTNNPLEVLMVGRQSAECSVFPWATTLISCFLVLMIGVKCWRLVRNWLKVLCGAMALGRMNRLASTIRRIRAKWLDLL